MSYADECLGGLTNWARLVLQDPINFKSVQTECLKYMNVRGGKPVEISFRLGSATAQTLFLLRVNPMRKPSDLVMYELSFLPTASQELAVAVFSSVDLLQGKCIVLFRENSYLCTSDVVLSAPLKPPGSKPSRDSTAVGGDGQQTSGNDADMEVDEEGGGGNNDDDDIELEEDNGNDVQQSTGNENPFLNANVAQLAAMYDAQRREMRRGKQAITPTIREVYATKEFRPLEASPEIRDKVTTLNANLLRIRRRTQALAENCEIVFPQTLLLKRYIRDNYNIATDGARSTEGLSPTAPFPQYSNATNEQAREKERELRLVRQQSIGQSPEGAEPTRDRDDIVQISRLARYADFIRNTYDNIKDLPAPADVITLFDAYELKEYAPVLAEAVRVHLKTRDSAAATRIPVSRDELSIVADDLKGRIPTSLKKRKATDVPADAAKRRATQTKKPTVKKTRTKLVADKLLQEYEKYFTLSPSDLADDTISDLPNDYFVDAKVTDEDLLSFIDSRLDNVGFVVIRNCFDVKERAMFFDQFQMDLYNHCDPSSRNRSTSDWHRDLFTGFFDSRTDTFFDQDPTKTWETRSVPPLAYGPSMAWLRDHSTMRRFFSMAYKVETAGTLVPAIDYPLLYTSGLKAGASENTNDLGRNAAHLYLHRNKPRSDSPTYQAAVFMEHAEVELGDPSQGHQRLKLNPISNMDSAHAIWLFPYTHKVKGLIATNNKGQPGQLVFGGLTEQFKSYRYVPQAGDVLLYNETLVRRHGMQKQNERGKKVAIIGSIVSMAPLNKDYKPKNKEHGKFLDLIFRRIPVPYFIQTANAPTVTRVVEKNAQTYKNYKYDYAGERGISTPAAKAEAERDLVDVDIKLLEMFLPPVTDELLDETGNAPAWWLRFAYAKGKPTPAKAREQAKKAATSKRGRNAKTTAAAVPPTGGAPAPMKKSAVDEIINRLPGAFGQSANAAAVDPSSQQVPFDTSMFPGIAPNAVSSNFYDDEAYLQPGAALFDQDNVVDTFFSE